jgi:hypothetical protein
MANEFGEEYSDIDIATQFQNWVIEVVEEIITSGRWFFQNDSESVALADGTRVYSVSADVSEIRQMYDPVNDVRIAYAPIERLVALGKGLADEGAQPTNWYIEGLGSSQEIQIGLYPVPNAAAVAAIPNITAYTTLRPAAMTSASTIALPEEYIRVAKDGIRAKVKFSDGDVNAYQLMDNRFAQGLQLLNARFHARPSAPTTLPVGKFKDQSQSPGTPEGR